MTYQQFDGPDPHAYQEVTLKFRTDGGIRTAPKEYFNVTGFYVEYMDNDMCISTTLNADQATAFGLMFNLIAEILEDAMLDDARLQAIMDGETVDTSPPPSTWRTIMREWGVNVQ